MIKQYVALMETEGVQLRVHATTRSPRSPRSPREVNESTENIGARRLHTVVERLLEQLSFDAPEMGGREVVIDAAYVREKLERCRQERRSVAIHSLSGSRRVETLTRARQREARSIDCATAVHSHRCKN